MKFDKIINEVFADKSVDKKDAYVTKKERNKNMPERWEPIIAKNGLNDTNALGALRIKKKKSQ